jgi:hypothetical protein
MRKVLALLAAISVALVLTFMLIAPGKQSLRQTSKSAQVPSAQSNNYQVWSNISPQTYSPPSCSSYSSSSQPWQHDFWRLYANQHLQNGVAFPQNNNWLYNWYPQHANNFGVQNLGVHNLGVQNLGVQNLGGINLGGYNAYNNLGYGFPQPYVPHGYFGGEGPEGPDFEEAPFLLNHPQVNLAPQLNVAPQHVSVAQSSVGHSSGASVVHPPRISGVQGVNYGVQGLNYGVQGLNYGFPAVPHLGEYEPEFPEQEWRWGALYNNWANSLSGCGGRAGANYRLAKVAGTPLLWKN